MNGDLDQLWYTWTTHGIDSGRGFQVRAASPRLLDKRDRALSAALRYCYRPLGERTYGWIERDGHRIVFNRVDAGRHSVGGGGNFFVHLILGSPKDLPASTLWSLRDAPFWQTHDPGGDDLSLPVLRAEECGLVEGEHEVDDRLVGFLAFLLHCIERRSGMQVPLDPGTAALASAAAAAVPDRFGLISFSTGETGSNAREYDIVCSDTRLPSFHSYTGPDDAADLPTLPAARTLLDSSSTSREIVDTIAAGPTDRREFVRNLITAVTYREGGNVRTDKVIDLVAARPEALNAMLDRRGMVGFADQLARGDHTALAVLPRLTDDHQRRAARRAAAAFADDPGRALGLLRTTVRHSPAFTRETAKEVLDRARDGGRLSDMRWTDRVEFIQVLAGSGAKLTPLIEQLLESESRVAFAVAIDGSLPTGWRIAAALRAPAALKEGRFDHALTADVEFARQYLRHRRDEPIGTDVQRITSRLDPTSALRWLQTVEPHVGPTNIDQARWDAIDRTAGPDELLDRLYEHSRGWPTLESATWESRLRKGLTRSIRSTARSPVQRRLRRWTKELDMLNRLRPRSAETYAWAEILHRSDRLLTPYGPHRQHLEVLTTRVFDLRGEERRAAALLALERACYAAADYTTFTATVLHLRKGFGNVDDTGWVGIVVHTAARLPGGPPGDRASDIVGRWALSYLHTLGHRPRRGGELRADLETIADRMSGTGQERVRRFIGPVRERLRLGVKRNRDRTG